MSRKSPVARPASTITLMLLALLGGCGHLADISGKPKTVPEVVLVGDSTVSIYRADKYPQMGWGMILGCGLDPAVKVTNLAIGGRSTKSFMAEGRWDKALEALDPGDVVLIQFGHNDATVAKPERYTEPALYRTNLTNMVTQARARGAVPVIVTPAARRSWKDGKAQLSHGEYAISARDVAKATKAPMIDLTTSGRDLLTTWGEEGSKQLFLHLTKEDKNPAWPEGVSDNTHFSEAGARAMAKLVVEDLARLKTPLKRYVRAKAAGLDASRVRGNPTCD